LYFSYFIIGKSKVGFCMGPRTDLDSSLAMNLFKKIIQGHQSMKNLLRFQMRKETFSFVRLPVRNSMTDSEREITQCKLLSSLRFVFPMHQHCVKLESLEENFGTW
jgi:hypothetical protein